MPTLTLGKQRFIIREALALRPAGGEFYKLPHKIFTNHIYDTTNFFVAHKTQLIPDFLPATDSVSGRLACDQMFKSLPCCFSCQGALVKS